ncbi:hypothetical protein DV738_g71, partial [Chaetothyriales sp. CBS 135597]
MAVPSHVAVAPASAFDPSLAALFASSSGPIKAPVKAPITASTSIVASNAADEASDSPSEDEDRPAEPRPPKRRRVAEADLEATYFQRLAKEEEREHRRKETNQSGEDADHADDSEDDKGNNDDSQDDASSDEEGEEDDAKAGSDHDEDEAIPLHESLTNGTVKNDEASRTVFLSNLSTDAIKSKASKKVLLDHLRSAIPPDQLPATKLIESFRFRSTPYVADGGPKRATYAKKELMEQTARSTNAYAVFATEQAASLVVEKLNGTVVLDRHLRLDKLTNPAAIDHKRCVFVGNLPFMDEELSETKDTRDQPQPRPKAKQPADPEEGLWRVFSRAGKVENVRVVRDKETRVSKGFAYVQFTDPNAVEAALLFDGKKYPPLLPRILRVSRAKRPRPTSAPSAKKPFAGSASRSNNKHRPPPRKSSSLVFEGVRASSKSQKHDKPKKRATKPTSRSARRGATFKASGGVKNRDRK